MTSQPNVSFALKTWDEKPYNELPGELKMTLTSVTYTYQGDIEGESTLDYLMVYRADGSGNYVGLERIIGRVFWHRRVVQLARGREDRVIWTRRTLPDDLRLRIRVIDCKPIENE
jgi:hypothetical protein